MQEAGALTHLSVATGSGDDDEDMDVSWPPVSDGMPRLLPVPSAWWETPAVTTRALSARPDPFGCLMNPRAAVRRPVHKANERASGLAFAQYIRQHVP